MRKNTLANLNEVFDRLKSLDNKEFAHEVAKFLHNTNPAYQYTVIAYNGVSGWDQHTISGHDSRLLHYRWRWEDKNIIVGWVPASFNSQITNEVNLRTYKSANSGSNARDLVKYIYKG